MIKTIAQVFLFILNIARVFLLLLMLLVLFGFAEPYIKNINSYPYMRSLANAERNINQKVKENVPTQIAGRDLSRLLTLIALFVLLELSKNYQSSLEFAIQKRSLEKEKKQFQQTYKSAEEKEKLAKLENKMEEIELARGRNRHELLKEFIELKRELEKIGRDLAFLSIDVVGSTEMKIGEDSTVIEHDFNEYRNYVEAKFKAHGYVRASWTPDGVMACFNNIEDAVATAQAILNGLEYFNKNVKAMKKPFLIRCGINAGFVYYDEAVPLEQLSDRTIDIAGHMQKNASPNGILLAKQIIEPVHFHEYFVPTERLVDGLEVYEWDTTKKSLSPRSR